MRAPHFLIIFYFWAWTFRKGWQNIFLLNNWILYLSYGTDMELGTISPACVQLTTVQRSEFRVTPRSRLFWRENEKMSTTRFSGSQIRAKLTQKQEILHVGRKTWRKRVFFALFWKVENLEFDKFPFFRHKPRLLWQLVSHFVFGSDMHAAFCTQSG